ncbi:ribosome assembly cofactor RimP [Ochrovirga pacifica]|uniref:ribosome assembly cofactor RimP n=1 Tax=Ochrovirga pacifica TaxID=1042376 RepID=UPI00025597F7|nr:ribosome assembly cofactor RimP [Ochrovirga pacifica]
MDKNKVENLVNLAIEENTSLFLVDLQINSDNKISVTVDGDQGVPLNECIRISRFVENSLDREEEDYSIEVATPDIAKPLLMKRQYLKNIGRTLKVRTEEKKYEGELIKATENEIELAWQTREQKTVGKGKVTVSHTATLPYEDIKEAKVKIVFS